MTKNKQKIILYQLNSFSFNFKTLGIIIDPKKKYGNNFTETDSANISFRETIRSCLPVHHIDIRKQ